MINKNLLFFVLILLLFVSCSSSRHSTYWVRGYKKPCTGLIEMECLEVFQGKNLKKAQWKTIYSSIQGFEFEQGYLKKVILQKEHLNPKEVPADASSIRYTLVKELKKKKDSLNALQGNWQLTHLDGAKVYENSKAISIHFNISQNNVYGSDSCNRFFGGIKHFTENEIRIGPIGSTKRWCEDMRLADAFHRVLKNVFFYRLNKDVLFLLDKNQTLLLQFKKMNITN